MRVAAAFDHRGVHLRDAVLEELQRGGHEVVDLGTDSDAVLEKFGYTVDNVVSRALALRTRVS